MKLGRKLKELRLDSGLTQTEIAKKLGISRQAISNWETNRKGLSLERAILVAKAFGVTPNDLLGVEKGKDDEK